MEQHDHALIVDDDSEIRNLLAEYLGRQGFRVSLARDGREMRQALQASRPDIVVLDIMLPGEDGLALCRDLRAKSNIPVIMLTARGEELDRIIGIEMGADDYLGKPFSPRELLARMKGVLRRARALPPARAEGHRLRFAGWTLDLVARHLVAPDGVVVPLGGNELMDLTLGRDATPLDRSIDVQVSRLRQRLRDDAREPRIIKTVRNGGYVLAATVERLA